MIDTHCHLLPGLDDGPATMQEAVGLAHRLHESGVERVLATPHFSGRYPTGHASALLARDALSVELEGVGLALEVVVSSEVSPEFAVGSSDDALVRRSIAGKFLIAEVQGHCPPGYFDVVHERLSRIGLVPIFCHPERAGAVQRDPTIVERARRRGGLVQVVAPSLLGRAGRAVAAASWKILAAGGADLLASDAHGTSGRLPSLADAVDVVERRLGGELRALLTETNAALVLDGDDPVRW